jgi:hypothetical protein
MPQTRRRQTEAARGQSPTLPSTKTEKPDRSVTIHPRVTGEEDQQVKSLAEQLNQPEMAIWGESASDGLIITLIKHGPDAMGIYGGRWTAKELAQIARRRILNLLIDFQYEQDELPALLRDYLQTLKALAEKSQGFMVANTMPVVAREEAATEEDALVFSAGVSPVEVNESLGGMGYGMLGLADPSHSAGGG